MTIAPRPARSWIAALLLLAAGFLAVNQGPVASAGDKASGRIDLAASLEPSDLGPGGKGVLVVKATLLNKEHGIAHYIYAKGENKFAYRALEAAGVTYHLAEAKLSKTQEVVDHGDTSIGWMNEFEIRVPVTLTSDAKAGTVIGLSLDYSGCVKGVGCYGRIKKHEASVVLGGGGASILDAEDGANPNPGVAAEPEGGAAGVDDLNGGSVSVEYDEAKSEVVVTFTPSFLHHMYGENSSEGDPIQVEPVEAEGVTWGEFKVGGPDHIDQGHTVHIPVEKTDDVKRLVVRVSFSSCDATGCKTPVQGEEVGITWPGAKPASGTSKTPAEPVIKGDLLFPVIEGDELNVEKLEDKSGLIEGLMEDTPILGFGLIFIIGLGLAFTPCVLPIVPITVSVITGGNADVPKSRLTTLLLLYVLGLSLAFATMGTIAAGLGGSLSAAFAMPSVVWGIAIVFFALAFSMAGVFELQPPAWLMKFQGGAQKKSGSLIGAFLFGILGAIIASPCTAPAVAVMLIIIAKTGDLVLGFSMFFSLGLGMGAVFFAAGALNFLMRPGPWMVWVRYVFSMLLFGAALYYLRSGGLISPTTLWVMAVGIASLGAAGVAWHLATKEGEVPKIARVRGIKVAAMWMVMAGLVWFLTQEDERKIEWIYVKDRAHLAQLAAEAKAEGKPMVVDFWAQWCHYCKEYDSLIAGNDELMGMFDQVKKVKVDLTDDAERWDLRHAVGLEVPAQPYMVLIDKEGNIRKAANVTQWYDDEETTADQLRARMAVILGGDKTKDGKPANAEIKTGDAGK